MLSHLNAMSFVDWATEEFCVTEEDRLSSHAPLHFDLSVFDLSPPRRPARRSCSSRSSWRSSRSELARWIRDTGITIWYSVPSILTLLVLRGRLHEAELPALRTVLFAGEVFPTKYLHQVMQILSRARFANLFEADRDERVHLVRGASGRRRADGLDPDRESDHRSRDVRGGGGRLRPAGRGRRAVRSRADGHAGLLGR